MSDSTCGSSSAASPTHLAYMQQLQQRDGSAAGLPVNQESKGSTPVIDTSRLLDVVA